MASGSRRCTTLERMVTSRRGPGRARPLERGGAKTRDRGEDVRCVADFLGIEKPYDVTDAHTDALLDKNLKMVRVPVPVLE